MNNRNAKKGSEMLAGYSISKLEEKIGYVFQNKDYITQALTHSSYANEKKINKGRDYERIEFLGDAVLELVSSEYLFKKHPDMPEGKLTKTRASMVCEPTLALCAREIELGNYIYFGKGEELTGGRNRDSIIADVMESIIGALYLDSGFAQAKRFIDQFILADIEEKTLFYDAKTILQEQVQKKGRTVRYELIKEEGPEHNKVFFVEVYEGDLLLGEGKGHSKKHAEQEAAYDALKKGKVCI